MKEDILDSKETKEDLDLTIRPLLLKDYIGQEEAKMELDVYIKAALKRDEVLDHCLLYGPPGLGKTTLANIIANEMGTNIKCVSAPAIEKSGDLASILTKLNPGDILFIDEIHRLPRFVEEILYSAMEDYKLDIVIGSEQTSKSITVELNPFTLVGATTRFGDISAPLRDRFGVVIRLDYYTDLELENIVKRSCLVYNTKVDSTSALEIAKRSRGTPRIANRLLRRVRDYALVLGSGDITLDITNYALNKLNVDPNGLDSTDINYLSVLINQFKGGPVGVNTLSQSLSEVRETIEDVYEPYLLKKGYINRTSRGRIATDKAIKLIRSLKDG